MRYVPAAIGFAFCIACVVAGIWKLRSLMEPPDAVFIGPGEYHFHALVADKYVLWRQTSGVVEDEFKVAQPALPPGARIRVESKDRPVAIVADASTRSSTMGKEKQSVLRFTAAEPGEFLITTAGFDEKLSFEITHGPVLVPLLLVIASFGLAGLFGILSVVFLILAVAGVFPKRVNRPPGPTTPSGPGLA
jgi:hypothetical protein